MKNYLKMLLLVFFLSIVYSYTLVIETIPNELVVFEGEKISVKTLLGLDIKNENQQTIETSSSNGEKLSQDVGKSTLEVSLFDNILLKNVEVSVLPKTKVIPVGNIAGVKLYTSGVLVVGMSEIEGNDNKKYKPYEITKDGDTWVVTGKEIERLFNMTKFTEEEGVLRFGRILRAMGVEETLEKMGAKPGDDVAINDYLFTYKG